MKLIERNYEATTPPQNVLKSIVVEFTREELDLVLYGLEKAHQREAGQVSSSPEDCRPISDLYHGLKY